MAAAQALATAGANVVITSRKQDTADEAAAQIAGSALGVAAHAVDEDQARRCVDLALETFGSVDSLVNNAGTNPAYGPMIQQDHARFAKVFDVNLWAPLLWKDHEPRVAASTALSRIGEPDDVAAAVVFLASGAAAWITGETMVIDGGQRLGDARPYRYGAMQNA